MLPRFLSTMSSNKGPLRSLIEERLAKALDPVKLVVMDESHQHRGHAGVKDTTTIETHFCVEIVSTKFMNLSRVQRQRLVNEILQDQFTTGLHALALTCKTPAEA